MTEDLGGEVKPFLPPDKHPAPSTGLTPASRFSKSITIRWIRSRQRRQAEGEAQRRRGKAESVVSALQFKWIVPEKRREMNSTLNHYF